MAGFPKRPRDPRPWRQGAPSNRPPRPEAQEDEAIRPGEFHGGRRPPVPATAWEAQADWYDARQGERGDDLHSTVVLPAIRRQLNSEPGQVVLDCCSGNGVLGRNLAESGIQSIGVDGSPSLVEAAVQRAGELEDYRVGDVHRLPEIFPEQRFDHAACVLALQDLDPLADVLGGLAQVVKPGGRLAVAMTHPCFRPPKLSDWGWDEEKQIQYRRLDGYFVPRSSLIRTHPGQGDDSVQSRSFHRPVSAYLNALGANGWAVVSCEELCSPRRGSRGRRSEAEDLAMREFPVFLVLTAIALPG